jgi:hypothetical protein
MADITRPTLGGWRIETTQLSRPGINGWRIETVAPAAAGGGGGGGSFLKILLWFRRGLR